MTTHLLAISALFIAFSLGTDLGAQETPSPEAAAILALTADAAAGKKRYRRECRACHGPTGKGVSSYPRLLDQPPEHLTDRLVRYRAGEKFGPNTPLMAPRARKLSDQQIADLTAFIVSLNGN